MVITAEDILIKTERWSSNNNNKQTPTMDNGNSGNYDEYNTAVAK